jgi:hypothetical protein
MKLLLSVLGVACLLIGCSKKESAGQNKPSTPEEIAASKESKRVNPQIVADLNTIDQKVQAKQYDAAVGSLLTIKEIPKTDAEEKEYQKRLYSTMDTLREKAQTDPKAQESYQMLGRAVTGR